MVSCSSFFLRIFHWLSFSLACVISQHVKLSFLFTIVINFHRLVSFPRISAFVLVVKTSVLSEWETIIFLLQIYLQSKSEILKNIYLYYNTLFSFSHTVKKTVIWEFFFLIHAVKICFCLSCCWHLFLLCTYLLLFFPGNRSYTLTTMPLHLPEYCTLIFSHHFRVPFLLFSSKLLLRFSHKSLFTINCKLRLFLFLALHHQHISGHWYCDSFKLLTPLTSARMLQCRMKIDQLTRRL